MGLPLKEISYFALQNLPTIWEKNPFYFDNLTVSPFIILKREGDRVSSTARD
jgi:hypothetical protein